MLARKSGIDPDTARRACRDYSHLDGALNPKGIEMFAQWALRKKYVDALPPIASLIDESLLKEVGAA
ncbi:MAG: hypothetical protein FJW31_03660 [Acidobacteria bacterium]|nr:hypothetical protein [Acidobacteriota bacterium]